MGRMRTVKAHIHLCISSLIRACFVRLQNQWKSRMYQWKAKAVLWTFNCKGWSQSTHFTYAWTNLLSIYSWLSLARIPRDSLKHFEISVPQNIRVAEVKKTINQTTTLNKWICNLTPEDRDILKILWKRGEIAPKEQFLLFSTIFCYLILDFHAKTGTRISLRDKQLLEISEV